LKSTIAMVLSTAHSRSIHPRVDERSSAPVLDEVFDRTFGFPSPSAERQQP
jgi:hypothetical protein